jgi:hypothetical protein
MKGLLNRRPANPFVRLQRACADGAPESQRREAVAALAEARLPYEEWALELTLLGLNDRPYDCARYSAALGGHLNRRFVVRELDPSRFANEGSSLGLGRLVYEEGADDAIVEVPRGLRPYLYEFTVFHELSHAAAGHPPRCQKTGERLPPPRARLARRDPLVDGLPQDVLDELYEAEADLRAEYAVVTGSLGSVALQTARLSQIA